MHGPLDCRICFADGAGKVLNRNGWRLVNDPGYWGSDDPLVLVLGQSKGNKQVKALSKSMFDGVAFAGIRDRLAAILMSIGLPASLENVDDMFTARENFFGFASLLRCSLSDPDGKTSGSPIVSGMSDKSVDRWISNCADRWLRNLNPRLRLVVFCGLSKDYVDGVMLHIRALHGDFSRHDENCAKAAGVQWIFVQHPSLISQNHYRNWIENSEHPKRKAALRSVVSAFNL